MRKIQTNRVLESIYGKKEASYMRKEELVAKVNTLLDAADEGFSRALSGNDMVYHKAERETLLKVLKIIDEAEDIK